MGKRFYVDTAIWRDYYENRSDAFRNLGEFAEKFFKRAVAEEWELLYSDMMLYELERYFLEAEIRQLLAVGKPMLCKLTISESQWKEAEYLSEARAVPFGDALHAVLARDNGAIVVTRDRDFVKLRDIADWRKPEELL